MKKKNVWVFTGIMILVLLIGAGVPLYFVKYANKEGKVEKDKSTFSVHTDYEVFQNVPIMTGKNLKFSEARDVGGGDYKIDVNSTTMDEYQQYLSLLEKKGFTKKLDNGENGLEGFVYTSHYQKDDVLVVVTHITKLSQTIITACEDTTLSEYLFYDEAYVADNIASAQTILHVPEMESVGNSMVIQLKNGRFILYDGGLEGELPYLLDYMESLVPEGEKPIIDAWLISHAHADHMGILKTFANNKSYGERVYIENVFFNAPSNRAIEIQKGYDSVQQMVTFCNSASAYLKSTDGNGPKTYRTRLGERYYFNDFTIDIMYSQELIPPEEWDTWNSTSTVYMFTIEGQKMMLTGDVDWECQLLYMDMYDSKYFDLTLYQAPHHGKNVFNEVSSYYDTIRTVIYPTYVSGSNSSDSSFLGRWVQNEYLKSVSLESMSWGDGTKILTFPYEVGTAKSLPVMFDRTKK